MKKEDIAGLLVWILLVAAAVVFYVVVLREFYVHSSGFSGVLPYMLFFVGAMVSGILVTAILLELAHGLGAKAGKYIIMSTNILGLMFYKDDSNKRKVKFASYDGLTGETKIYPNPKAKKEPNPTPYLLMGSLFFAVEILVAIFFFYLMKDSENTWTQNFAYFILTAGVTGGIIFIYNIVPLRLDNMTDGYRLRLVGNAKARKAFNDLLRTENGLATQETETVKSEVEVDEEAEDTAFSADLAMNKVYKRLENKDYDKALEILDTILNTRNVAKKVSLKARALKIYIDIMYKDIESVDEYYEKEISIQERRDIADDNSMPCIRTYILLSGLCDKSKSECVYAINKVKKALKHTVETRQEIEKALFNETIDKVHEAHPKWGLDQHKL